MGNEPKDKIVKDEQLNKHYQAKLNEQLAAQGIPTDPFGRVLVPREAEKIPTPLVPKMPDRMDYVAPIAAKQEQIPEITLGLLYKCVMNSYATGYHRMPSKDELVGGMVTGYNAIKEARARLGGGST